MCRAPSPSLTTVKVNAKKARNAKLERRRTHISLSSARPSPRHTRLAVPRPSPLGGSSDTHAVMLAAVLALAALLLASAAGARPGPHPALLPPSLPPSLAARPPLPVVLWHGMGDSCCAPHSLGALASAIKKARGPGAHVLSLSFGGGPEASDVAAGFFGRVDDQVAAACSHIAADPVIAAAGRYDAVGFSQGGQFLRAVAQRCGGNLGDEAGSGRPSRPTMRRLITLGAQHQGVASLPLCPLPRNASSHAWSLCAAAAALAAAGVDAPFVRTHLIQAQYYKDPAHLATYRRVNAFLADINNEHACDAPPPEGEEGEGEPLPTRCPNPLYARALASLDRLVLIRFARDQTVVPRDSSWFADLKVGTDGGVEAVPLRESELFKQDWIGLQALDKKGALFFEEAPGPHMQFGVDWFVERVVERHLMEDGEGPAKE